MKYAIYGGSNGRQLVRDGAYVVSPWLIWTVLVTVILSLLAGFFAGYSTGAVRWQAKARLTEEWQASASGWKRGLLACQEVNAEMRVACPGVRGIDWGVVRGK